jgi:hypothetical protein
MSEWIDRVKNHAVWEELRALGPVIDGATGREGNDASITDGLERLRTVLAFCGKRLAATDPVLLEPAALGAISKALARQRPELEAFMSDGNVAHVTAANVQADAVVSQLSNVLTHHAPDDLTWLSESAASYKTTLENYLKEAHTSYQSVNSEAAAVEGKLGELKSGLESEKQKLSTLVSDFQQKFSTAQDARAQDFSTAQNERQEKYVTVASEQQAQFTAAQTERQEKNAAALSEHQAQFSAAQSERQEKHSPLLADYTKKLSDQDSEFTSQRDAAVKEYQGNLAALKDQYEQAAKAVLDNIESHKRQVEKLVGVIGNLGVTSGYQKVANHARKALYIWQGLTVLALGLLVAVAWVIASSGPVSDSLFYQGFASRVFLSITVGIFAAYAAKQAANSWQIERRNRKLALELEALGPYIAPLPEEMQNKFREQLGERSFGVPDDDLQKPLDKGPVTAWDLINSKDFRELLTSVVKAAK